MLFRLCQKALYRSFNAIFGKIGRSASEEVVLNLIQIKCLPCMLYGLEACPINKTERRSLDFPVTRILMKLFKTTSSVIIAECQSMFNFPCVHELVKSRKIKFLAKFANSDINICRMFSSMATEELLFISSSND